MLICSIRAWAPPGADTWRHHPEERPADAGHMCWTTWWVLRSFLVDFTITASATARLLRWRQYACIEGLQRREVPQRASGQRFVPATGGICWHTGRRTARTIRHHTTRPLRQIRSVSNCTSPMSADYTRFDADCAKAKCRTRAFERRCRRTMLDSDRLVWIGQARKKQQLFATKQNKFWEKKILTARVIPRKSLPVDLRDPGLWLHFFKTEISLIHSWLIFFPFFIHVLYFCL